MAGTPITPSIQQFLADLVAIRVQRGLDHDALHRATLINPALIEHFERSALLDHPLFNAVYQRAILRSYAGAVQVDTDGLTRAFDAAMSGVYRRELAVAYLGLPAEEAPLPEPEAVPEASSVRPVAPLVAAPEPLPPARATASAVNASSRFEFRPAASPRAGAWYDTLLQRLRLSGDFQTRLVALLDRLDPVVAVIQRVGMRPILQWGGLVVAIGIGLVMLLQLVDRSPSPPARPVSERGASGGIPEASAMTSPPEASPGAMPRSGNRPTLASADIVLQDSLILVVVADRAKLDPFRVQLDQDLRRPYWLDQGDSLSFQFASRFVVEERLEDMAVLFEGIRYPLQPADTTGRVVITRDSLRLFLAENRIPVR